MDEFDGQRVSELREEIWSLLNVKTNCTDSKGTTLRQKSTHTS